MVTNPGPALTAGDSFDLFNAGSQTSAFATITLPVLSPGLRWNTNLFAAAGVISVENILPPQIVVSLISGPNLILQYASQTGTSYVLQSTTNIAPPILWSNNQTNSGTGATQTFQVPISSEPQRFFRVMAY